MRALVVEDYEVLRESLAKGLRDVGYAVDATGEGREGLWYAENHPYDVIILDLMLPAIADRVAGLDLGADDYMVKPFAFDELVARLRALVRRRYAQVDPVVRVADLEIDTRARKVRRAGQIIGLSAREYALLEYLAHRVGHIVSRTELWDHAYDEAAEANSNVLDVHISHLRRKIDDGHAKKLIHTRRGQGYVFGEDE
jgi:DNA-binding response OmpR family regulator